MEEPIDDGGAGESDLAVEGETQAKTAELYSESTNVKRVGKQKEVVIEKEYNRDGNSVKIVRVENFQEDGPVEVNETFTNGYNVKTNKFVQDKDSL
jgi:hypothetical protein